jgi:transposase
MAIWQELVDEGFPARYASVRRFVRRLRGSTPPEPRVVITTAPGEEAQVDYGEGPMVRHPQTSKYRRTRLFVLTLGYSRKAVRLLVWQSSAQTWAELHERAFRRLGGTTRVVVLDNLKEGVLTPDVYDAALNPVYRDMLAHYGVVALPCRVRDPDRKGKVESSIGHTQRTPLHGLRFESLEQAQTYLDRWEAHWADTRIHGTTKRDGVDDLQFGDAFLLRFKETRVFNGDTHIGGERLQDAQVIFAEEVLFVVTYAHHS